MILVTLGWPVVSRAIVMDRLRFLTFWIQSELEKEQKKRERVSTKCQDLPQALCYRALFLFFFSLCNRSKVNLNSCCEWNTEGFCLIFLENNVICWSNAHPFTLIMHLPMFCVFNHTHTHTHTRTHTCLSLREYNLESVHQWRRSFWFELGLSSVTHLPFMLLFALFVYVVFYHLWTFLFFCVTEMSEDVQKTTPLHISSLHSCLV